MKGGHRGNSGFPEFFQTRIRHTEVQGRLLAGQVFAVVVKQRGVDFRLQRLFLEAAPLPPLVVDDQMEQRRLDQVAESPLIRIGTLELPPEQFRANS